MYWYNPKTRSSERVEAPSTDDQAIRMLADTQELCRVHKGVLQAAALGDAYRASISTSWTRVPLEADGLSASSAVGDLPRYSGERE